MKTQGQDSTGGVLQIGDTVRYRGELYTIESFPDTRSSRGYPSVKLQGLDDPECDEVALDLFRAGSCLSGGETMKELKDTQPADLIEKEMRVWRMLITAYFDHLSAHNDLQHPDVCTAREALNRYLRGRYLTSITPISSFFPHCTDPRDSAEKKL